MTLVNAAVTVETEDGRPYLVMELVDGQSLSELLRVIAIELAVARHVSHVPRWLVGAEQSASRTAM